MAEKIHRLLDRLESRISLWGILGGGSIVGVITGWLSRGVDAIDQFGWFGWWSTGLIGALIAALFFLALAWMHYAWVHARSRRSWEQAVQHFNPLERDFRNMRLRVSDLAHPISRKVSNKRLYDCELLGPENLFFWGDGKFDGVSFSNCTVIVLWPDSAGQLNPGSAVVLENIEMHGGSIWEATILITPNLVSTFRSMGAKFATLTGDEEIDSR